MWIKSSSLSSCSRRPKNSGVELVGPSGLLNQLTKNVLETALDAEMSEHLGYDKHDPAGRGSGNSRNGTRAHDGTVTLVSVGDLGGFVG